jgi:hypothetical protein
VDRDSGRDCVRPVLAAVPVPRKSTCVGRARSLCRGTLLAALLWRSGRVGRVGLGAESGRGSFVSD